MPWPFLKNIISCAALFSTFMLTLSSVSQADSASAYQQAIELAAQGQESQAIASLGILAEAGSEQRIWQERMIAARDLLQIRLARQTVLNTSDEPNMHLSLAKAYASSHPQLDDATSWPAAVLATMIPGAGHAWQGRWRDAATAAMLVWPMLLLTLWAGRRRMGPVTVFFAVITIWLWSGTVFSAVSLAERSSLDAYMVWWQAVWQASGLPGRPW